MGTDEVFFRHVLICKACLGGVEKQEEITSNELEIWFSSHLLRNDKDENDATFGFHMKMIRCWLNCICEFPGFHL